MTTAHQIIILPAQGCRRSRRCWTTCRRTTSRFTRIDLETPEGQALATQHDLRASPGILVDGVSVNPFDLLIQPACRVDEARARALFGTEVPALDSSAADAARIAAQPAAEAGLTPPQREA